MKKIRQALLIIAIAIFSQPIASLAQPCASPATIISMVPGNLKATITWNDLGTGTVYNVWYRPFGTGSWSTPSTLDTSIVFSGLSPNTLYEVAIKNSCYAGGPSSGFGAIQTFTTLNDPCAYPATGLDTTTVGNTTASFKWNSVGVGAVYSLWYKRDTASTYNTSTTTDTTLSIGGLTPGQNYEIRVRNACSSGEPYCGFSSPALTFTTLNELCALAPVIKPVSNLSPSTATLNWQTSTPGTTFSIWYRIAPAAWNTPITTDSFLNLTSLQPETTYEYAVRSKCASGGSYNAFSATMTFTTCSLVATGCDTIVQADGATETYTNASDPCGRPILKIADAAGGITLGSTKVCGTKSASVIPSGGLYGHIYGRRYTNIDASSNGPGTVTLYYTQADFDHYNANNPSFLNLPTSNTDVTAIPYIRIAKVTGTGTTAYGFGITMSWDATNKYWKISIPVADVNGTYYFYTQPDCIGVDVTGLAVPSGTIYGATAIATWNALGSPYAGSFSLRYRTATAGSPWIFAGTAGEAATSKLISGLTPATSYYLSIRKDCSQYSNGPWSDSVAFSTSSDPCYIPATFITPFAVTSTTATIKWNAIGTAYKYFVWYKDTSVSTWNTPSTFNDSMVLSSLTPGTTYDIAIKNNCVANGPTSAFSPTIQFTTLSSRPNDIQYVANESKKYTIFPNPTSNIINLEWESTQSSNVKINVYDLTGRLLKQINTKSLFGLNQTSISLSEFSKGLYTLQILEENKLMQVSTISKSE